MATTTDIYKEFIYYLRLKECENTYIIIWENPSPALKEYAKHLINYPKEYSSFSTYYEGLQNFITSFLNFYTYFVDEGTKNADKYSQGIDKNKFIELIDETIHVHDINQEEFLKEFQPPISLLEKERLKDIEDKYLVTITELFEFRKLSKSCTAEDRTDAFVKAEIIKSLNNINLLCELTHEFISRFLVGYIPKIKLGLEETVSHIRKNINNYKKLKEHKNNELYIELYKKNKESLEERLGEGRRFIHAVINKEIDAIREKIRRRDDCNIILPKLQLEYNFYTKRLEEFLEIVKIINKVQKELETVVAMETKLETESINTVCPCSLKETITQRKKYLEDLLIKQSRPLITFFSVRGFDRVLNTDRNGAFYLDKYGHQIYITQYGLKHFHVNCRGQLSENTDSDPYYFDERGRYVIQVDEKIYQLAPCTSNYKLTDGGLFKKITKDCGHSEVPNARCKLGLKNTPPRFEMVPTIEPVDIKQTLDKETGEYLWDAFGWILPEVIYSLRSLEPPSKNPIHQFAHMLLIHKYKQSTEQIQMKKQQAEKYRTDILKRVIDEKLADGLKWKSRQWKRPGPDADDTVDKEAYNAYMDQQKMFTSWIAHTDNCDSFTARNQIQPIISQNIIN